MLSEPAMCDEVFTPRPVMLFKAAFERLDPKVPMPLDGLYDRTVLFEDPIQRLYGLAAVRTYFERLNSRVEWAEFKFTNEVIGIDGASLEWVMTARPRGLGRQVRVPGVTILRFRDKITSQRDYYDVGAMVYEHVPVLGSMVKALKKKL
jgi:hypothetical protein